MDSVSIELLLAMHWEAIAVCTVLWLLEVEGINLIKKYIEDIT